MTNKRVMETSKTTEIKGGRGAGGKQGGRRGVNLPDLSPAQRRKRTARAGTMLHGGHASPKIEPGDGGREPDLSLTETILKTVQAGEQA